MGTSRTGLNDDKLIPSQPEHQVLVDFFASLSWFTSLTDKRLVSLGNAKNTLSLDHFRSIEGSNWNSTT